MSRIRQTLTLHTSLSTVPLNFTLQATIPSHMLSLCASTLPRPSWEPLLYYAAVLAMGFLLFCIIVASYFEADRISVTDSLRRRAEMSQAAAAYEKGRVFDLRTINGGLKQSMLAAEISSDRLRSGQTLVGSTFRSRISAGEVAASNGHVVPSSKLSYGDSATKNAHGSTNGLMRRFLSRHLVSRNSRTALVTQGTEHDTAAAAGRDAKSSTGVDHVHTKASGKCKSGGFKRNMGWFVSIPRFAVTQLKSFACGFWVIAKALRRLSVSADDGGNTVASNGMCLESLVSQQGSGVESGMLSAVGKSDSVRVSSQPRKSEKSVSASSANALPSSGVDEASNSKHRKFVLVV